MQRGAGAASDERTIGGYALLRRLGQGGMGAVWEAEHLESGRLVALKVMSPNLAPTDETIERFLREARLAASLSHPRSTFVFGAGEHQRQPFIVMELMPGRTLQDVIDQEGALPVPRAVDYMLDAIEGLEAAHALGVIHRDVKPSNCFLDGEGRVKIGDFGLSKSLMVDAQLTRTGAFMGTPMFAAPEQVRGGEVDKRTDIYGVAATLYYLLAKRGPFTGDAVAMIAQIASDRPTPLREVCPHAPQALEQIIGRALEKDPAQRYQDLAQLRDSLLPFATGGTSIADVWRRLAAYMLDMTLIGMVGALLIMIVMTAFTANSFSRTQPMNVAVDEMPVIVQDVGQLVILVFQIGYFAVAESLWGCGVGKLLMGLRVVVTEGQRPALWRTILRSWFIPGALGWGFIVGFYTFSNTSGPVNFQSQEYMRDSVMMTALGAVSHAILLLCLTTMRARNGYRGVHEFASGTRVVRLRRAGAGTVWNDVPIMAATALGEGKSFGPFRARGRLGSIDEMEVLVAQDEMLHRAVWILKSREGPGLSAQRRKIARPTRPRWLQGGDDDGAAWDAVEAVHGAPLPDWLACTGRLEWARARGLLRDLAGELAASEIDGSMPERLSLEQVWIDRSGRLKLLEAPLTPEDTAAGPAKPTSALGLLRTVVDRSCGDDSLPGHAQSFLHELRARPEEPQTLAWAARELDGMMDRPARLDWAYRMATMAVSSGTEFMVYMTSCLAIPLALWKLQEVRVVLWVVASCALCLLLPAILGFAFRGGPVFRFMKIEVRRRDGKPASRLRCGWRNFLAYGGCLYFYSLFGAYYSRILMDMLAGRQASDFNFNFQSWDNPQTAALAIGSMCSAEILLVVFLAGAVYALVRPQRGLQDLLAGTQLVPK
jgi:hypothetical protein